MRSGGVLQQDRWNRATSKASLLSRSTSWGGGGSTSMRSMRSLGRDSTSSANTLTKNAELDVWNEVEALATEFVLQEGHVDDDGHQEDACISVQNLPGIVFRLLGFSVEESRVTELLEKLDVWNASFVDFDVFVRFMHEIRPYAYEQDKWAGFDRLHVYELQRVFQRFCRSGKPELRTTEIFDVLRELGAELNTKEEQEAMIEVIKEADKDRSGATSFEEFLQIMRRITNERDIKKLDRDWRTLGSSGFSEKEIAEMRQIFDMFRAESGKFDLRSMRQMLERLGIKLKREEAVSLNEFMRSESEEFPRYGYINFPEYCTLMRRLIDSNFAGMRRKVDLAHDHEPPPTSPKESEDAQGQRSRTRPGLARSNSGKLQAPPRDRLPSGNEISAAEPK